MTEDTFHKMVENIKIMPVLTSYIIGIDPAAINRMCMAWVCAETRYVADVEFGTNPWDHVEFDIDKFKQLAGCRTPGLFEILVKANILYPDGTFNELYMEVANGKRKSGKAKGNNGGKRNDGV